MNRVLPLCCLCLAVSLAAIVAKEKPYDFRANPAYAKLSDTDRQRLEQVQRDFVLLWGALDMYADDHDGRLPTSLNDLVPRYLAELPTDPFATKPAPAGKPLYTPSKKGLGYGLRSGSPGNRAWVIASVGLPDFPYLAERGNVGLYICKGVWLSGINPTLTK